MSHPLFTSLSGFLPSVRMPTNLQGPEGQAVDSAPANHFRRIDSQYKDMTQAVSCFFSTFWCKPFHLSADTIYASEIVEDHSRMAAIPECDCDGVWQKALDRLEEAGVDFPRGKVSTYRDFLDYLSTRGIAFSDRVKSLKTAFALAKNNELLADSAAAKDIGRERPIAAIVVPKSDWNGAFTTQKGFPLADTFCESGLFDVVYVECGTDIELKKALCEIRDRTGHRLHTVVLAGHGTRQTLQLGGDDSHKSLLEVDDLEKHGLFDGIEDVMEPDGQILLWSCSNAETSPDSDEGNYNLAEAVSYQFPERAVFATPIPTNISSLTFSTLEYVRVPTAGFWGDFDIPIRADGPPRAEVSFLNVEAPVVLRTMKGDAHPVGRHGSIKLEQDTVIDGVLWKKGTRCYPKKENGEQWFRTFTPTVVNGALIPKNASVIKTADGSFGWRQNLDGRDSIFRHGAIAKSGRTLVLDLQKGDDSDFSLLAGSQTIQGLRFQDRSAIDWHKSLYVRMGTLEGVQRIQGFLFEDKIEFYDNGRVKSGRLSKPQVIDGTLHPAGLISFDREGRVVPTLIAALETIDIKSWIPSY